MRTLLTGASGFLGSRLLPILTAAGHDVLVLTRSPPAASTAVTLGAESKVVDLSDAASATTAAAEFGPEACIHLAWQGIPDFSDAQCRHNLLVSANLMKALAEGGTCRRVLAAGSCFEYGKVSGACVETQPLLPNSFFTWAKRAVASYGATLAAMHSTEMLWFRIFYMYGIGQRSGSLIPSIVSAIRNGQVPDIRNPANANDFVYVDDVAEAFAAALTNAAPSGTYNLGSGAPTTVRTIYEAAYRQLRGATPPPLSAGDASSTPFWADTTKATSVLRWTATTDIASGVGRYIAAS